MFIGGIIFFLDNRVRGCVCIFMCGKFKNLEVVEEVYYFIFSDCLVELIVGGCKLRK